MPWTYLEADAFGVLTPSQASAGSPRPFPPGARPSPTASGSGPARPSSSPECSGGRSTGPRSGTTSRPSGPNLSPGRSTSSSGGSPARTSPTPGRSSAWTASVPSFIARASGLLGHFDPNTCSLRTSQLSLFEGETPSSPTLPRSGMTLDGRLYALRTPTHPQATAGSGGSASPGAPTPAASPTPPEFELESEAPLAKAGRGNPEDRDPKDVVLWPTPTFSDGKMDGHSHSPRTWKGREIRKAKEGIALQFPLSIAIRVARIGEGWAVSRDLNSEGWPLLPHDGPPGRRARATKSAGKTISPDSRVLNPLFLAMLMGFGPTDVTRLEVTAMAWTLSPPGSPSDIYSPADSDRNID